MEPTDKGKTTCSHCLQVGHNKRSPLCPLKGMPPAPQPEKEPPPNRWTPERESILIDIWQSGNLEPDWDYISLQTGMSPYGCKTKLYQLKSKSEIITTNIRKLNLQQLTLILQANLKTCATCNQSLYDQLHEWQGIYECFDCHRKHLPEIEHTWHTINTIMNDAGTNICHICSRHKISDTYFEFDHINMFQKKHSICELVYKGSPLQTILDEIKLCRLICKSCHYIITKLESLVGFTQAKALITRQINSQDSTPAQQEDDIISLTQTYSDAFLPIYDLLRQLIKS